MSINPERIPSVAIDPAQRGDKRGGEARGVHDEQAVLQEPVELHHRDSSHIEDRLAAISCDRTALLASWHQSESEPDALSANLERAEELEQAAPGSVGYLQRELGIEHFSRYPRGLLLNIYASRSEAGPWGVVIYAKDYHNDELVEHAALEELAAKLGTRCRTRLLECATLAEVTESLGRLRERFGQASFAVFCAHGTPDSIQLCDADAGRLTRENARHDLGPLFESCLKRDAEICLTCCSTGQAGAIAEDLSAGSQRQAVAPAGDANLRSFGVQSYPGGISFRPEYGGASARHIPATH